MRKNNPVNCFDECVALSPLGLRGTRRVGDSRQAVHVPSESLKAFFEKQKMLLGTFSSPPFFITTQKLPTTRACAVSGTRGYG